MNEPTTPPMQFADILRMFARRKVLLVTPWLIAVGLGAAAALLLPPVYFSNVTLLIERPQAMRGALGEMISAFDPERQLAAMRDQVQSSPFLRDVIVSTGMTSDPATRAEALKGSATTTGTAADELVMAYLTDKLRDAITIRRAKGGSTFQVSIEDRRPARARRLAEAVANQFIIQSKTAQLEGLRRTQEFSNEQEQIYKRKVDESEGKLEAFKRGMLNTTMLGTSVGEGNLARARTLLDQADLDVQEQTSRVATLRQQNASWIQSFDPEQISSPESNQMAAQIKGLERQLAASSLSGDGDDGASARAANARKMSEIEMQFTQNASVTFPSAPPEARDALVRIRLAELDLQARQTRRAYLASQVGGYEQHVVMSPETDAQLKALEQDVDNARALYNSFLQQSASNQITEAFENARVSGRFSILEPANLPVRPDKPNKVMLILLGFVLGGAVGVASVFVVERNDQSMRNAEEVEMLLGLPVVGAIPRVEQLDRRKQRRRARGPANADTPRDPGLLHRLKTESPLGLEFRRIFIKLAQSRGRTMPHTLLVTSSTRGEGKTTTSACLAITLARELEDRILLVDFDLRSPALHRALGIPSSSWGLAQMLAQRKFDERFVRSTVLPNLDFLGAGKSERPASELVDSESVNWFLTEARSRYPIVLLDTAPTLAVPDPLIVGRAVEGVLYVIKAGQTVRKAAEYGVKVQREAKDNIVGVLLNDAGEILPHYYGYHDAYGYASEAIAGDS